MISKFTCIVFSCLLMFAAQAQPVLTGSTPKLGYKMGAYSGPSVSPGSAGTNVTWDFTSASLPISSTVEVVAPSATPFYSQYSSSNFAVKISAGSNSAYNYYNYTATKLEVIGTDIGSSNIDHSLDNKLWVKLPFSYQNEATDTWKIDTMSYTDSIKYDGYGTLITPFDTFHNVVRVKAITYNTTGKLNTTYTWFKSDSLFQIMTVDDNGTTVLDLPVPTSVKQVLNKRTVAAFPNPAVNELTIDAGISNGTITIADAVGRQLKSIHTKSGSTTIDVADMNPGIYSYTLQDNYTGEVYVGRFVISR